MGGTFLMALSQASRSSIRAFLASSTYGRGCGVGRGLGVGVHLPVHGVGVGVGAPSQYLPPVFKSAELSFPPQTIIAVLVETAVCCARTLGALVVLVAVQLSVPGLYLP